MFFFSCFHVYSIKHSSLRYPDREGAMHWRRISSYETCDICSTVLFLTMGLNRIGSGVVLYYIHVEFIIYENIINPREKISNNCECGYGFN